MTCPIVRIHTQLNSEEIGATEHRVSVIVGHVEIISAVPYGGRRCAFPPYTLTSRSEGFKLLKHQGALLVDALPEQLPVMLVNRYPDIKSGGLL